MTRGNPGASTVVENPFFVLFIGHSIVKHLSFSNPIGLLESNYPIFLK